MPSVRPAEPPQSPSRFPGLECHVAGRAEWHLHPEWSEKLLSGDSPVLSGRGIEIGPALEAGQAEIVKTGPHRTVYRLQLADEAIYLKHYRIASPRAWLQNNLRPCRAFREAAASAGVQAAGIATAEMIGCGRLTSGPFWGGFLSGAHLPGGLFSGGLFSADSFFLCREIPQVQPLDGLMAAADRTAGRYGNQAYRRRVVTELARLTAQLHRQGLYHSDYHAGNLLVRSYEDWRTADDLSEPLLWLIDLHPLRKSRLSDRRRWSMLGMLSTSLSGYASEIEHQLFFEEYAAEFGKRDNPAAVRTACDREFRDRHAHADRKWTRKNRRYLELNSGRVRSRGLTTLGRETLAGIRDAALTATKILPAHRTEPLAVGDHFPKPADASYADASYSVRRLPRQFGWWSPSRRAWETGHALLRRGFPVAKPVLFAQDRNDKTCGGAIVTEGPPIPRWSIAGFDEFGLTSPRPATLLFRLGRLIRALHDGGFDPHAHSIGAVGRRPCIIEPERIRRGRISFTRRRMAVAQFLACLSDRERGRFLWGYAGHDARLRAQLAGIYAQAALKLPPSRPVSRSRRRVVAALFAAALAPQLLAGCKTTPPVPAISLPEKHSIRAGHLVVVSDFKLGPQHPLINDLSDLREQVTNTLQLPEPRRDVTVYLFSGEEPYRRYLETVHPGLPPRRAYFVGTSSQLAVYSYWGERVQEDLRHEYTHGLLHASLKTVPLWLDEGLAEYFETPGEPGQMNSDYPQQLATAVSKGWQPNIDRLEAISEFSAMKRIDYQESWAWVHYLLHSSPESRHDLIAYLHDLRDTTEPPLLSARLNEANPSYAARFLGYVANMNAAGFAIIRAETPLF